MPQELRPQRLDGAEILKRLRELHEGARGRLANQQINKYDLAPIPAELTSEVIDAAREQIAFGAGGSARKVTPKQKVREIVELIASKGAKGPKK